MSDRFERIQTSVDTLIDEGAILVPQELQGISMSLTNNEMMFTATINPWLFDKMDDTDEYAILLIPTDPKES